MAEKKKYQIKVQGQLVPVSKEVYLTYYRMRRHERHLEEKDIANGVFYYSALDTEETNGEDAMPDLVSPRVEDIVTDKLMAEKLHKCLACLCCFSKRMRKVFRKNEKSMLQNCNKKAKRKGRLQRVKKPM